MSPIRPSSLQHRTIYSARLHPVYSGAAVPSSSSLARLLCSPSPPPPLPAVPLLPPPSLTPFYADSFYCQASTASSSITGNDDNGGMLWTDSLDARSDTSNDASGDEEMEQTGLKDNTAVRLDSPFVESGSSKKKKQQPQSKKKASTASRTRARKSSSKASKQKKDQLFHPPNETPPHLRRAPAQAHYRPLTLPISQPTVAAYPFLPLLQRQQQATKSLTPLVPGAFPASTFARRAAAAATLAIAEDHDVPLAQLKQHFEDEDEFYIYARDIFAQQAKETGCTRIPETKRGKSGVRYLWCRGNRDGSVIRSPEKKCRWTIQARKRKTGGAGGLELAATFTEHNPRHCLGRIISDEELERYTARANAALGTFKIQNVRSKQSNRLAALSGSSSSSRAFSSSTDFPSTPMSTISSSYSRSRSSTSSSAYSHSSGGSTFSSVSSSSAISTPGVSSPLALLSIDESVLPDRMDVDHPMRKKENLVVELQGMDVEDKMYKKLIVPLVEAVDTAEVLMLLRGIC